MKMKTLIVLAIIASVLVIMAVKTNNSAHTAAPTQIGKLLVPDLPVNDIVSIVVSSGTSTTRVQKVNNVWVAPDRYGYPVRFEKVTEALLALADLKIREELRLNDEQKKTLHIFPQTPVAGQERSTLIELSAAGDRKVMSLLLGDIYERSAAEAGLGGSFPDGHYVSADNGKTVYLVSRALNNLAGGINEWLNSEIVSVETFSVTNFTISTTNGAPLDIKRNEKNELTMDSIAADEEVNIDAANGMQYALSYFRFDDVADPAISDAEAGMTNPDVFRAMTKNGETYTIKMGAKKAGTELHYVRCEVDIKEEQAPETPPMPESFETNAPGAAAAAMTPDAAKKKEELEKAREKVRKLQNTSCKWTYLVQSAKLDSLRASRERLVTKKVEAKPEDKAPGAAAE